MAFWTVATHSRQNTEDARDTAWDRIFLSCQDAKEAVEEENSEWADTTLVWHEQKDRSWLARDEEGTTFAITRVVVDTGKDNQDRLAEAAEEAAQMAFEMARKVGPSSIGLDEDEWDAEETEDAMRLLMALADNLKKGA